MNDYYETAPNTYKRGYVNFPITNLPLGRHSLTVKAWDVNNNSAEGTVDFEVVAGGVVKVQHLINYPNPFTDVTHFMFEHNHPDEPMAVEINVYNTSGQNVRNLKQNFTPTGSRSNEISWDGTDNQGARLPSGVYVYRVKISTDKGISTLAYQKLVIVR
jgi:flagellar hook assembly protein FlgD